MTTSTYLPVATRGWTLPLRRLSETPSSDRQVSGRKETVPFGPLRGQVLIFDTETTVDMSQSLTFGSWIVADVTDSGVTRLFEGLFTADDLEETDPAGLELLRSYVGSHRANVSDVVEANPELLLKTRAEFVYEVFMPLVFKARRPVVCFNKAFDVSRIARGVGETRGRRQFDGSMHNGFEDGFSFILGEEKYQMHQPRVRVKHIDSKKAFASFTRVRSDEYVKKDETHPGTFLDLRTLIFALTGESHSLSSACKAFDVVEGKLSGNADGSPIEHGRITSAYVDYNRRDTLATAGLLGALNDEFGAHSVFSEPSRRLGGLRPAGAYSAASVAKSYLRGMGITSPRSRFAVLPGVLEPVESDGDSRESAPDLSEVFGSELSGDFSEVDATDFMELVDRHLARDADANAREGMAPPTPEDVFFGVTMSAFYGGRAEVRIRHTPVPVQVLDFTSMYPTVNALMGNWGMLTAEKIEAFEDTESVRELVSEVTLDDLFRRGTWPGLVGLVQVVPDGDIFPVRADYSDGGNHTIGVNPVYSDVPLWYTITDVIASKLITGKTRDVLRAVRYQSVGTIPGLRPVRLRGAILVDPVADDCFTTVITERSRVRKTDEKSAAFLKVVANSGSYGIFAQVDPDERH